MCGRSKPPARPEAVNYINSLDKTAEDVSSKVFDDAKREEEAAWDATLKMDGTENAYMLHKEMGEIMTKNVTVVRHNDRLQETDNKLQELIERYDNINITDTTRWSNQGATFTRQLKNMMYLARVITLGALNRNESRGAHYKPDFPERDDENFLKTTIAEFDGVSAPKLSYEDVDVSLIEPRKRDYTSKSK